MSGLVVTPINQEYRIMAYSIHLEGDTLKVDFAKTDEEKPIPAAGDVIVQDVQTRVRQMIASGELSGGICSRLMGGFQWGRVILWLMRWRICIEWLQWRIHGWGRMWW